MNPETPIVIGERQGWGEAQPFGISPADHCHHIYIIGKTGSGKTTLLRNLLIQHIRLGHGVGLIDPHGDLAEELLNHVPARRADHLVYFNPGDLEFPIGLNLLSNVEPDDRHLVASGIVGALKNIWRDSWGPRLEYILYNSVAALLDCPNTTLLGVNRMLTDETYRASLSSGLGGGCRLEVTKWETHAHEKRCERFRLGFVVFPSSPDAKMAPCLLEN